MRYHKAIAVTRAEADFIIATGSSNLSDIVVISYDDKFYDVRKMTRYEIDAFVADLARAEHAALQQRAFPPC